MKLLLIFVYAAVICSMSAISVSVQVSEPRLQTASGESKIYAKPAATIGRQKHRRRRKIFHRRRRVRQTAVRRESKLVSKNRINIQSKQMSSKNHPPQESQNKQTNRATTRDAAQKAGTFDGDLRRLPKTKPRQTGTPKVREPNDAKPKVYVNEPTVDPEPDKF